MKPGQPWIKTNWITGKVNLTILIGSSEVEYVFSARSPEVQEAIRAGKINGSGHDVNILAEELESFLKGLGYTPYATEHMT